ncbi:MAG: universal stress protein UspA [Rhodoferax sp.]|nr:universal stress protein UspA [Rhodoferax sp.]
MYQRILVPVDGSPTSDAGLAEAIRLAGSCGGRLHLVHVIDDLSLGFGMTAYAEYTGDWLGLLRENGADILKAGQAAAQQAGVEADTMLDDGFAGSLTDVVQHQAASWHADLIVLGTHGRRGVGRLVLGSDAERILRSSQLPVLLVRGPAAAPTAVAAAAAQNALAQATAEAAVAVA